jgi:hypothetical protein
MTTRTNKVGDTVTMTGDAIDNYGDKWADVALRITHKATRYMPAEEFYTKGKPKGFHPGYDGATGDPLFDLEVVETGEPLSFSLYQWEIH